jgi:Spy/CpxP family protein refolding chaperone
MIQALLGLSLLLNLFVLAGFVYSSWIAPAGTEQAPGARTPAGQRPSPLEVLADELKLDGAQRAALKPLFDQYGNARRERSRENTRLREQIAAELKKPDTDLAKLEPVVDQLSRLRAESQKETLRAMIAIEPQLRADQREQFEKILAERLGGWWGRRSSTGQPGRPQQR